MSSNRTKPSWEIAIDYKWCLWVEYWRKNGHEQKHDKMILQHDNIGHMFHQKTYLETLKWEVLSTRRIHHTLSFPIITCSNRWHMAWLSSTSILMKIPKNESTLGLSLLHWPFWFRVCCSAAASFSAVRHLYFILHLVQVSLRIHRERLRPFWPRARSEGENLRLEFRFAGQRRMCAQLRRFIISPTLTW